MSVRFKDNFLFYFVKSKRQKINLPEGAGKVKIKKKKTIKKKTGQEGQKETRTKVNVRCLPKPHQDAGA